MEPMPHDSSPGRGYSLIELLVVLVIIGVLAIASVSSLGPKSPKAVRSGLLEVRAALQQARQAALSSGRNLNLIIDETGIYPKIQAYDAQDILAGGTPKPNAIPLVDVTLDRSWLRYATFTTSDPPVSGEITPIKAVPALALLGFTGWSNPLLTSNSAIGFSPSGTLQSITATSRSGLTGGTWVGIRGLTLNQNGLPYGVVIVTERGLITAFYKADSNLTGSAEFQWQRLD
jgi:prepilin-type N-terminal cleavage/methylation domain-containing protein